MKKYQHILNDNIIHNDVDKLHHTLLQRVTYMVAGVVESFTIGLTAIGPKCGKYSVNKFYGLDKMMTVRIS